MPSLSLRKECALYAATYAREKQKLRQGIEPEYRAIKEHFLKEVTI